MQQNLNPKEKKRQQQTTTRNRRNAFPPAASGRRRLLWLCCPLLALAALCPVTAWRFEPRSRNSLERCYSLEVKLNWNIEKWPTATFCEKTTKASHRKQSDGRNRMEPLPFISLFVTNQSRLVCSLNLSQFRGDQFFATRVLHNNFLWNLFSQR